MAQTRSKSKKSETRATKTSTSKNLGRKRGAPGWEAWEDRAIAKQARATRPWAASKEEGGPSEAWDALATTISRSNEKFNRSGPACQARFKKLLGFHKNNETRDKQATGETAEIDEHVEAMTDIYNQMRDHLEKKKIDNSTARAKILMERKAGAELRDACMTGVVPWDTLSDITRLSNSTPREKGGQRTAKKRTRSPSPTSTRMDVKPDPESAPKRRKSARQRLLDDIRTSREHTLDRIDAAQKAETKRAAELQATLQGIAGAMSTLSSVLVEDRKERQEDREERRRDHTNLMTVVAALAANK
ncbi:hypothetical protein RSOL_034120 [Rhizoctonia solani AG-3 Rhs1AP]|uniref:Myb-like domain-containing protein n=1 Tax=Rhizoctonia solani AG-3 Rhs1AP TaxID=1086054 RepID=X8IWV1_9AGAM|nr:hypothetical protein RSOL_034120 [Rhizoctonia solani AG-3 Rhs1AP]